MFFTKNRKFIVTKTPLRLSLAGGSTDLDAFLMEYERGSVISFTPNLYTFISLHSNNMNKYIINYSKKEVTSNLQEIKNDIAKYCLDYFNMDYCTVTFNSNILASGSGLASSSSYTISLIKAITIYQQLNLTDFEVCDIAFNIEKKFNPLAGQQDIYGCGIGGFKRIDFALSKPPSFRYLDISFITQDYEMYLLNTNIIRNSTDILQTIDVKKIYKLLDLVENLENSILKKDKLSFFEIFKDAWLAKKQSSSEIMNNQTLTHIDSILCRLNSVSGYKLCGSGGGGYFLIFVDKNYKEKFEIQINEKLDSHHITNIKLDNDSIRGIQL